MTRGYQRNIMFKYSQCKIIFTYLSIRVGHQCLLTLYFQFDETWEDFDVNYNLSMTIIIVDERIGHDYKYLAENGTSDQRREIIEALKRVKLNQNYSQQ